MAEFSKLVTCETNQLPKVKQTTQVVSRWKHAGLRNFKIKIVIYHTFTPHSTY